MKFGRQIEEYELPEWRGHYIPYRTLKQKLQEIQGTGTEPPTPTPSRDTLLSVRGLSERRPSGLSVLRENGSVTSLMESGAANLEEQWRAELESEATRVGDFVARGLEGLEAQLKDLDKMTRILTRKRQKVSGVAVDPGLSDSGCDATQAALDDRHEDEAEEFLELRVLEAVGLVAEGGRRLRGFATINHAALYKILKKHDKILGSKEGLARVFPKLVERTRLGDTSRFDLLDEELRRLSLLTSQTEGLDASAEVARLAAGLGFSTTAGPGAVDRSRNSELVLSFFLGCSTALFLCIGVLLALPEASPKTFSTAYFLTPMPVFRVVFSVLLSLWCMGAVAMACDKADINYLFVLNVDPRCRVTPEFFFSRAATLTTLWILIFGMYVVDYKWRVLPTIWNADAYNIRCSFHFVLYPILLLMLTLLGMIWPSRICRNRYKASVANAVVRTATAPMHRVDFSDNMVGDILTSLAKPLQDVPAAICYLFSSHPQRAELVVRFQEKGDTCSEGTHRYLLPVIGGLPYVFRALQCLRRYHDTRETRNLWNFGKYIASLLVVVASSALFEELVIVAAVSAVATVYAGIWDITLDWGLTRKDAWGPFGSAGNSFAEQDRTTPKSTGTNGKSQQASERHFAPPVYMLCCVVDLIARSTWVLTLMPITILSENIVARVILVSVISSIEIVRRSMWAVLRIEHEQVANASGFRALLWVPSKLHVAKQQQEQQRSKQHGISKLPSKSSSMVVGDKERSNSLRQPLLE